MKRLLIVSVFLLPTCLFALPQNQYPPKQIRATQTSDCVQEGNTRNCVMKYEPVQTAVPPSFWRLVMQLFNFTPAQRPFERSVAFLVGVSKYEHLSPQLPYVDTDLKDMQRFPAVRRGL